MKRNQLKTGVLLSYANLLIGNLIPFIYTPIMLRLLGQQEFGLYGIAASILGYLGLLNFGIGGSIVRYLSKYKAENDIEGEKRVFGLFIKLYSLIGIIILIAGTFLSFHLSVFRRSLSAEELSLLKKLVLLMTINTAVFMPFNVYSSIIIAHERFVFSKLTGILTSILTPCINLVFLWLGYGSVGLVLCAMGMHLLTYALYVLYTHKTLGITPSFKKTESGVLQEILRFSSFVFLAQIVDILYWSTDKLIIGWALGSVMTAIYNIGASFNGYITSLSTAVSGLIMPRITSMAVKDVPKEEYDALFIKIGRLQFILISFIISAFVAFGRQFIALWAGKDYAPAYYVALLTMIPVTVPLIQNTGLNILYALNRHRFRSVVYLCVAIANVALTFWWVERWGIIGAAGATCIAYVIGNIFIMNVYYHKAIGLNIPRFWKNILRMSPIMFIMGVSWWFILDAISISNWLSFFGLAIVYSVLYCILAYRFMMNSYEKNLIASPIKKLWKRISKQEA
ncbi:MAG: polysaccharide biosynthesis protein [Oscillospiraceae bacterium]|nr:polysaccharide biosynthesis protein [Oscillospiraceae bacterium]